MNAHCDVLIAIWRSFFPPPRYDFLWTVKGGRHEIKLIDLVWAREIDWFDAVGELQYQFAETPGYADCINLPNGVFSSYTGVYASKRGNRPALDIEFDHTVAATIVSIVEGDYREGLEGVQYSSDDAIFITEAMKMGRGHR